MSTTTRVRLSDFLLNPEIDDARLELINGEVTAKPMPTWGHSRSALKIAAVLDQYGFAGVEPRAIIPAAGASPIPDVAFFRDGQPGEDEYMRTPPHVAVEILSAGQSLPFMRRKAALYASFGVESVWIVDLERREVHVIESGSDCLLVPGERLSSAAVPGLEIDVAAFFPS